MPQPSFWEAYDDTLLIRCKIFTAGISKIKKNRKWSKTPRSQEFCIAHSHLRFNDMALKESDEEKKSSLG